MKKILKIIAILSGVISILSSVILGLMYMEDLTRYVGKLRSKFSHHIQALAAKKNSVE